MKILTYVEIDIDYCANTYGLAPCTASIPTTGSIKCFNSLNTCQDRPNFVNAPVTLRFTVDCNYLPADIEAIPSIESINFNPARVSLGENLGERATLSVTFADHRHSDTGEGFDKYYAERPYDPFTLGTFFGKFRARQPFLRGRAIRLIRGTLGQSLAEMDTRHYIIDSFDGPTPAGMYTINAKDVLKLADDDRAQAPVVSNGFLSSDITTGTTSITLNPAGIGNLEYPASGFVAIGGNEICSFTRSGDVLTIVRGQIGTIAATHDAQDRVQLCLQYVGEDPADIIYDLLANYAGIDTSMLPLTAWQAETAGFLGRLYSATVADPTGVNKLVSELIEQAGLMVWWDDQNLQVRLQVLRSISTLADSFDEDNTMEGSLATRENPNSRVSQVWTYYGQKNPLKPLDEVENWRSTLATVDLERESDYGSSAIKKIFARWIPAFGRSIADRLNDIVISRFRDPPRSFSFDVFRHGGDEVVLGAGYQIGGWTIQDATGAPTMAPIQVTRLKHTEDRFTVEADELLIEVSAPEDLTNRTIIIDSDFQEFNLRTVHDGIYPEPVALESPSIFLTCIIETNVIVGANTTATPAFDVGTWPAGVDITIINRGRIQGAGGRGGDITSGGGAASNGFPGGTAFYSRYAIDLDNSAGEIWGGGGGGGGPNSVSGGGAASGGGGGAGQIPGNGGAGERAGENDGLPGTTEAGGASGPFGRRGGDGGDPGLPGDTSSGPSPGSGGAAGASVDGNSFVTYTAGIGDRRGSAIN